MCVTCPYVFVVVSDNDQIRRKQLNKDGRPHSAPSVSPRSSRASLYTPPVKTRQTESLFGDVSNVYSCCVFSESIICPV